MKKRQFLLTAILIGAMTAAAGCSSRNTTESAPPAETEAADEGMAGTEEADSDSEQSALTGVIDEIKDFMFVVTDESGDSYAFSFEGGKPKGLDDVKAGDKVVVTYTGEISVVDPFMGEILSIEKVK